MLNHITIMGRLVRDPELRYTQNQTPVASFTVAVDRDFSGRDGGEKQTDFIDCTAWRGTAEFVNKYFAKGSMAVVSGRLQMRDWTDKDGNKRRNAEVVAENIYFGESKKPDAAPQTAPVPQQQQPRYRPSARPIDVSYGTQGRMDGYHSPFAELADDDGDMPF